MYLKYIKTYFIKQLLEPAIFNDIKKDIYFLFIIFLCFLFSVIEFEDRKNAKRYLSILMIVHFYSRIRKQNRPFFFTHTFS